MTSRHRIWISIIAISSCIPWYTSLPPTHAQHTLVLVWFLLASLFFLFVFLPLLAGNWKTWKSFDLHKWAHSNSPNSNQTLSATWGKLLDCSTFWRKRRDSTTGEFCWFVNEKIPWMFCVLKNCCEHYRWWFNHFKPWRFAKTREDITEWQRRRKRRWRELWWGQFLLLVSALFPSAEPIILPLLHWRNPEQGVLARGSSFFDS